MLKIVATEPFDDQKPGTSGLRKKVKTFQQSDYTENFIQSIFDCVKPSPVGSSWIVGGDGRYYMYKAIQLVIKIAAANGVKKLYIAQKGILSTPAASHLIRSLKTDGGILLTASHNPGGPDQDFGIKVNNQKGAPISEKNSERIFLRSQCIKQYKILDIEDINIAEIGTTMCGGLEVEIIDAITGYVDLMKSIFDFDLIRGFITQNTNFSFLFDGLNGVTGPYAKKIFEEELLIYNSTQNCIPKQDFGGSHPDPNLVHAESLLKSVLSRNITLGAAADGDGDRNMIYGASGFVSPNDSLAVIAYYHKLIPRYRDGISGVARSFATSSALDRVAKKLDIPCYITPTGWKFFCNLYDTNMISISGEESFGTSGDHIREKDGVWAVLAWLNIFAALNKENRKFATLKDVMMKFWQTFGRCYFARYDYEELDFGDAEKLIEGFKSLVKKAAGTKIEGLEVCEAGNFSYSDPIDHSVSENQGLYLKFNDESKVVIRLSGTGTTGATLRIYLSKFETSNFHLDSKEYLNDLFEATARLLRIKEFTARTEPTLIT